MRTAWHLKCKEKGLHTSSSLQLDAFTLPVWRHFQQQHCKSLLDQHAADGASCLDLASRPAVALCGSRLRACSVLVRANQASVPTHLSCNIGVLCRVRLSPTVVWQVADMCCP